MQLGVIMDIGSGTTDIAVFNRGHPPLRSYRWRDNITNDIAVGLRCPIAEAERLKIKYGHASASQVSGDERVSLHGRLVNMVPRMNRGGKLFKLAYNEIRNTGIRR